MKSDKIYRVSFCVHDYYTIVLTAESEDDALTKAEALYDDEHEDDFTFDLSRGGTDEWEAEEVRS